MYILVFVYELLCDIKGQSLTYRCQEVWFIITFVNVKQPPSKSTYQKEATATHNVKQKVETSTNKKNHKKLNMVSVIIKVQR